MRFSRRRRSSSPIDGLIVWRFHHMPHRMKADMIMTGVVKALGWTSMQKDFGRYKGSSFPQLHSVSSRRQKPGKFGANVT